MWIVFVLIASSAWGYQLRISPAPLAVVDENSDVTLTCDYNGTSSVDSIEWHSNNLDYQEYTWLNMSCFPLYETSIQNKSFTCNESIGKFQMTIINANRDRNGQIWNCLLHSSNDTFEISNWTMLNIRGNLTETSCSKNHDAEICPYPIATVKENETLVITVKVNVSRGWIDSWSYEYTNPQNIIYGSFLDNNCTIRDTIGEIRDGYNFTCNPSEAIMTFTWDRVQRDRNGHTFMIDFLFYNRSLFYRYILILVQEAAQDTTHQFKTTISPISSLTASTSMAATTKLPPIFVPKPGDYELKLEFDVKVEMEYNPAYADTSSLEFENLTKAFTESLTEVFKNLRGFKSIDILQFSRGSVIADYSVNMFSTVDIATVAEEIGSKIVSSLTFIAGVPVNTTYTNDSMKNKLENLKTRDKCSLASNACPFGYYCEQSGAIYALPRCRDRCNSSVCQNNGECYVTHLTEEVQCRCAFTENVVYTGERCATKTEVLTVQQRNIYIIIACSLIGGILLVFISTVCFMNRKRKRLKKRLTISHVLQLDGMYRTGNDGVRAMDARYIISVNPALKLSPEGYCDERGHINHQDHGLDGGYMQVKDSGRNNSDADYDYIGPHPETGSRALHD